MATAFNWRQKLRQIETAIPPAFRVSVPHDKSDNSDKSPSLRLLSSKSVLSEGEEGGLGRSGLPGRQPVERPRYDGDLNSTVDSDSVVAFDERAAIVEDSTGAPRAWAEGFACLNVAARPRGFTQGDWEQVLNDGGRFLDAGWAGRAAAIGWSALDVFGVHPIAPNARYDAMGLVLLIRGGDVIDIRPDRAVIRNLAGNSLVFYLRRETAEAVALWDLANATSSRI